MLAGALNGAARPSMVRPSVTARSSTSKVRTSRSRMCARSLRSVIGILLGYCVVSRRWRGGCRFRRLCAGLDVVQGLQVDLTLAVGQRSHVFRGADVVGVQPAAVAAHLVGLVTGFD